VGVSSKVHGNQENPQGFEAHSVSQSLRIAQMGSVAAETVLSPSAPCRLRLLQSWSLLTARGVDIRLRPNI